MQIERGDFWTLRAGGGAVGAIVNAKEKLTKLYCGCRVR